MLLMSEVKFIWGEDTNISEFPLEDGQILVGLQPEHTAEIYVDAIQNEQLIRFPLGYCDASYADRLDFLENMIFELNSSGRPIWGNIDINFYILYFIMKYVTLYTDSKIFIQGYFMQR